MNERAEQIEEARRVRDAATADADAASFPSANTYAATYAASYAAVIAAYATDRAAAAYQAELARIAKEYPA